MKIYDVIIIGAGPAGLSAALYSGRAAMDTLIIEQEYEGGQLLQTSEIVNYPGVIPDESGFSLIQRMVNQAAQFGVHKVYGEVVGVSFTESIKEVQCRKESFMAKTIIIAAGMTPRLLGCPGETEFLGRGVSRCATCDGAFFKGLDVYVIGGGDSALEEALFLTKFAKTVIIVHRKNSFNAAKNLRERVAANDKISTQLNTVVKEITGTVGVEALILENLADGSLKKVEASTEDRKMGVFIFIGFLPKSKIFNDKLQMENGYIITDEHMSTSAAGVFAAGDIRHKTLRQVVTAVSDGAEAAVQAEKYLQKSENFD